MATPVKANGYKWVALLLPILLGAVVAFFAVKSDVRVVEANVVALEDRMEMQYRNILRELDTIKDKIR